jgi:hypothetical protein
VSDAKSNRFSSRTSVIGSNLPDVCRSRHRDERRLGGYQPKSPGLTVIPDQPPSLKNLNTDIANRGEAITAFAQHFFRRTDLDLQQCALTRIDYTISDTFPLDNIFSR